MLNRILNMLRIKLFCKKVEIETWLPRRKILTNTLNAKIRSFVISSFVFLDTIASLGANETKSNRAGTKGAETNRAAIIVDDTNKNEKMGLKPIDLKPIELNLIILKLTGMKSIGLKPTGLKSMGLKPIDLKQIELTMIRLKLTGMKAIGLKPRGLKSVGLRRIELHSSARHYPLESRRKLLSSNIRSDVTRARGD